jgi:hypothetical protein
LRDQSAEIPEKLLKEKQGQWRWMNKNAALTKEQEKSPQAAGQEQGKTQDTGHKPAYS